ncbi:type II toxin-antitoxin system HicB family antitoxin [Shewanella xiamenensis]|uniref:type II toxin-antitoxin system HicB family antitoxin n=1 Tax=Shewanella xiamenensis TaxID=332186 RepID=UPI002E7C20B4|nr:type II toxin-antitoxin system HicB family antitoxin [Shewanella xiamenensis]
MSKTLSFKGYTGSIEVDVENECLYGKLLFINDVVTYEASDISSLKAEFNNAVNDYIETCAQIDKEPEKPFKGAFNIRTTPDNHRKLAIKAAESGTSINDEVCKAIEAHLLHRNNTWSGIEQSTKAWINIGSEFSKNSIAEIYQIGSIAAYNCFDHEIKKLSLKNDLSSRPVRKIDFNYAEH